MWDTIKEAFKTAFDWLLRYPLALIISMGVIVVAVILLAAGVGDRFNVGGIIGKLFGKRGADDPEDQIKIANEVPEDRVDEDGNKISLETEDEEGWKQKEVKQIDRSGNPFRDKSKIQVQDGRGNEKILKLPKGVKDLDVEKVIEVKPKVYDIVVKEAPKPVDDDVISYLRD